MLTSLYVPADRPDRIAKAVASGANCVIIDLEDSVAPSKKDSARSSLVRSLAHYKDYGTSLQVRINACSSKWHHQDVLAVNMMPPDVAIRLPKVEHPEAVREVRQRAKGRDLHALIETPLGVERAYEIASSGVASIGLGEADLLAHLGIGAGAVGEQGLTWVRSRVIVAAAAAGLPAPQMSVYPNVHDLAGLEKSCLAGREMGFVGRTAIHPGQLPIIRKVFGPTAAEVARAQQIIESVEEAVNGGAGVVVLNDGTFLDVAMVRGARRVLEIASQSSSPMEK